MARSSPTPAEEPTSSATARPTAPRTDGLEPPDRAVVEDELEMSARVGRRIAKSLSQRNAAQTAPQRAELEKELVELRDLIGDARAEDVPALLAQMMRTAAVAQLGGPKAQGMVDARSPYFGHLRLEENGRRRDVLIGKRSMVDRESGVVIVDWRNAPVSRIYYRYDEGDEYEEEFGEKVIEGEVVARRTVGFSAGEPLRITTASGAYVVKGPKDGDREWVALPRLDAPELKGGVGVAARAPSTLKRRGHFGHEGEEHLRPDKHLPEIAALIDKQQFEAMTQTDAGVIVLQGGAGSGKTTVALHRIAYLVFQAPKRFRPKRCMVVVHQPALVRYVERVLPSLEVEGVRVQAYVDWARWALSRVLPRLRRKSVDEAPPEVSALKKHPGMLKAIDEQLERRRRDFEAALDEAIAGKKGADEVRAAWESRASLPLMPRIEELMDALSDRAIPRDTAERARRPAEAALSRLRRLLDEWEELITDRELLATHVCSGDFALKESTLVGALRWTKRQIEDPDIPDDVDPSARKPVDGRAELDVDDPLRKLDPHDPALLLNLWIARTGGLYAAHRGKTRDGKAIVYDHIAVDEAQDLSAVEVRPLLIASGKHRSMTLAGDIVQKVVFDNYFDEWETLLEQVGARAIQVEPFRLTYRSTAEVVDFARDVLGPLAPETPPAAVRSGAPVEAFAFDDTGEEIAFLAENLRSVMGREPRASVAVLVRHPERARFFARMLDEAEVPRLRLVDGPDAVTFAPGVDVTHIAQVKGLEYDYVVLADANAASYPDEVAARHLLHIGATRAAYQLWVTTSAGAPSPLLPKALLEDAQR
jgi:DNA helicase-2/ATP-dependent DNA helicase PcrA